MEIIPESIQAQNTVALDHTFQDRLISIGADQLAINLVDESDMLKLSLYLQQFGVPIEILPDDMGAIRFRDLLQRVLQIYRQSGTVISIRLIAEALGASSATIDRNAFILDHARQARYDSLFRYDQGREYKAFSVDVRIGGISEPEQTFYEQTMRRLFYLFEPIGVHLRKVIFEVP